ncbi:glycoside hydrolase family 76 protein [Deinococcus koreensis]|uniref:CBM6 domain-containing protein n=1 Tax=Deinococcus koreensis TaxID=2054903 RepID=A0A2K3UYR0_9DEIO|nr:glycoside hydrolase family 76 protein [Deinococcus koreensis]PNY81668.1 hypothetical protein CVO96_10050 [Deinococcus koreensis]
MRAALQLAVTGALLVTATGAAPAQTPATPTPVQPADMWRDFSRAYWRAEAGAFCTFSDCRVREQRSSGPEGGRYSDFWWAAQLYSLTLDAAEGLVGTGATPPAGPSAAQVQAGFLRNYDPAGNDYNDDLGWLAQAELRAHEQSGDPAALERARALADRIWQGWDSAYGGGVWWRRSVKDQKNVATNAPLVATHLGLYRATGEAEYLQRARLGWVWLRSRLIDGPRVYDHVSGEGSGAVTRWDFTYNFGAVMDAGLAMAQTGGDPAALQVARDAADWALRNLTQNGVLLDEGAGDGGGFKGVFVRALRELAAQSGGEAYARALARQAQAAWNARRADGLTGTAWDTPPGQGAGPDPLEPGALESLSAGSAVAAVLAAGPQPAGVPWADGRYEAENARRLGVESSDRAPGHSGRGYVNDFHTLGQGVAFTVNAPRAGRYRARVRYSAGGGWASRRLDVNGSKALLKLPATPDWQTWASVSVPLTLPAGASTVQVLFGPQDAGWLNLDAVVLEPL